MLTSNSKLSTPGPLPAPTLPQGPGSGSPSLRPLFTCCCLQPQNGLLLLRSRASNASFQLPLFVFHHSDAPREILSAQASTAGGECVPPTGNTTGREANTQTLTRNPAHTSLPSYHSQSTWRASPQPKRPSLFGGRTGLRLPEKEDHQRRGQRCTGAAQRRAPRATCLPGRS